MQVYIRTEANEQVGYGHLGRCVALVEEFHRRGVDCQIVGLEDDVSGITIADTYKDIEADYHVKDDPYKPLIRDEFAHMSCTYDLWHGDCGQAMLEQLYRGRGLNVKPKVENQYPYYDFVMKHGLYDDEKAANYARGMTNYRTHFASEVLYGSRFAQPNDRLFIYALRNSEQIREVSNNPKPITWLEHCEWFNEHYKNTYIIFEGDKRIGVYHIIDGYISLYIAPEHQNKGYGRLVLESLKQPLKASIKPDNYKSLTLFTKAGFKFDGENYVI